MQSSQAPVHTVQAKMLGQPILQLIFPLSVNERECENIDDRATDIIKGLDIVDVFLNVQPQLLRAAGT